MAFIKDQRTRAYQKFLSVVTSAVSDSAMLSVAGQKLTANVEQPTGEALWLYSYQGGCIVYYIAYNVYEAPRTPSTFWNNKNYCVFNKRTVKVCVSCS